MKKPEIMIANEDKAFCHNLKKHLAPYRLAVIEAPDKTGIPHFFQEKKPKEQKAFHLCQLRRGT